MMKVSGLDKQKARIENLDYLRGLAACGIMVFHFFSWVYGEFKAQSILGRIGLYGVSVFYVLSGLTLYYVYYDRMQPSRHDLARFARKRVLRILPLLALATIGTLVVSGRSYSALSIFLNLTGLFGFVDWSNSIAIGAWSIGNELVFYVFFIAFVFLKKKMQLLFWIVAALILTNAIYSSFYLLSTASNLSAQWHIYINPINQLLLFLGGFIIGDSMQKVRNVQWVSATCILIAVAVFMFYPVYLEDRIGLVTGTNRFVFVGCCFLLCIGVYKLNFSGIQPLTRIFLFLGQISYSIYILHPLVFSVLGALNTILSGYNLAMSNGVKITLSIVFTVCASFVVYRYFETYFLKIGRRGSRQLPSNVGI